MKSSDHLFDKHLCPMAPIPTGLPSKLEKMKPFSAILFDVYGTLLISRAGAIGFDQKVSNRTGQMKDLLDRFGIDATPDQLAARLRDAISRAHAKSRSQGIIYPEVDIVQVWNEVLGATAVSMAKDFAMEYELIINPTYPMPGLKPLLAACRAGAMPIGIISNAQFYTPRLLSFFLGANMARCGFDERLLFFSWQAGHAKPSPFMFERAKATLEKMGIPPDATLYMGNDMRNDIFPAASVGFVTALYAGDQRSLRLREADHRCRHLQPDLIVTDLQQLIDGLGTKPARG
jgi:putative hydrolase of the HAD superfamily